MMFPLQLGHVLSLNRSFSYLPISIRIGSTPNASFVIRLQWYFGSLFVVYSSGTGHSFHFMYVQSFGLSSAMYLHIWCQLSSILILKAFKLVGTMSIILTSWSTLSRMSLSFLIQGLLCWIWYLIICFGNLSSPILHTLCYSSGSCLYPSYTWMAAIPFHLLSPAWV